jgi:hypothetical protein
LTLSRRIGVASHSHKAINNLLLEVERQALERKVHFRGAKKCSAEEHQLNGSMIVDLFDNEAMSAGGYDLIAGTAWLLSRPEFDQTLDTLFIDEAGQVSIANVVAMGVSARNIVLVGDQMQLGQPMQGVHPGESGTSALEFLLGGLATVPKDRGIFFAGDSTYASGCVSFYLRGDVRGTAARIASELDAKAGTSRRCKFSLTCDRNTICSSDA